MVAVLLGPAAWADQRPERVVSVNLCTDQLGLLLADSGQLISVSRLAHEPDSSAMVEAARALPANGSGAEEVYLLTPDLVLAGTFTDSATVQMLRDLGIRVELFAPARSLEDVPARLRQMGAALGRTAVAEEMVARFEADLAALTVTLTPRPRAALYYVNSYTSGDRSLASDILAVAGFDNVASEVGLDWGGVLPLEKLVMLAPDLIIQGRDYPGQARAEDTLDHPALLALSDTLQAGQLTDRDWICGTPQVLNAIRAMRDLRLSMEADR
ncbi:ABC transporter substrate-binding protein [Aestuariivita sp.]|jgi:iron complex transport system substrate-binding protein|uniref:ABC transporter substrate-binding protein n=1 Tax=Aestuariivita sp. TaxID=1872407 RepID=UPI0025C1C559|nr:ABC transporter substrate-binding protein [Aestuariivita sp.]